jgi:hypothetical protein
MGKELVEDHGGRSARVFHEGFLRDPEILDGVPIELGALCARRGTHQGSPEGTNGQVIGHIHEVPPIWRQIEADWIGGPRWHARVARAPRKGLLVTLADGAAEGDFPVVDANVEPAVRV